MSFTFFSTRIKIKYNYNIAHINTEFVQKNTKSFHHLWCHVVGRASKLDIKICARQFYELLA